MLAALAQALPVVDPAATSCHGSGGPMVPAGPRGPVSPFGPGVLATLSARLERLSAFFAVLSAFFAIDNGLGPPNAGTAIVTVKTTAASPTAIPRVGRRTMLLPNSSEPGTLSSLWDGLSPGATCAGRSARARRVGPRCPRRRDPPSRTGRAREPRSPMTARPRL